MKQPTRGPLLTPRRCTTALLCATHFAVIRRSDETTVTTATDCRRRRRRHSGCIIIITRRLIVADVSRDIASRWPWRSLGRTANLFVVDSTPVG